MLRRFMFLMGFISALPLIFGDDVDVVNLTGVLGGSVHLRCQMNKNESFVRIYFQKKGATDADQIFINGFDLTKPLTVEDKYRNRSSVNERDAIMELSELSLSDKGDYSCIVFDKDYKSTHTEFHLTVTASYAVPMISLWQCSKTGSYDTLSCTVTCLSSGGYPLSNVRWAVIGGGAGVVLREASNMSELDSSTGLWNVSQNATLNCTEQVNLTCTIGGADSSPITLCVHHQPTMDMILIVASVLLLLTIIIIAVIFTVRVCRRPQHQVEHGVDMQPLNPPNLPGQAG